jgi:hypothetical protein
MYQDSDPLDDSPGVQKHANLVSDVILEEMYRSIDRQETQLVLYDHIPSQRPGKEGQLDRSWS